VVTIEEVCLNEKNKKIHLKNCFIFSGIDRRGGGGGGNMNGNRNAYNNNNNSERGTYNNSRPSRFSGKRSRSRSPVQSTHKRPSRFDNPDTNGAPSYSSHGSDYKRLRTDSSRPSHVRTNSFSNRQIFY
jgi:hypothetical protein